MEGSKEPVLTCHAAGLERLLKDGCQGEDGLSSIGWIGLTAHNFERFQAGDRYTHRLVTNAFGLREARNRCGAISLQAMND